MTLPDPRRLALLHALGLSQVHLRRDELAPQELARLLPTLPGMAATVAAPSSAAAAPAVTAAARPGGQAAEPVAEPVARSAGGGVEPAPARLQRIGTLDLGGLAAFAHDCRACKLGTQRRHAVPGVGHPAARVMVVGEAPGAEEDQRGEPFVGAAGRLLDNMLRAIGLARDAADGRDAVFIANVIKCRPPGNRNPEPDEIAQCAPILRRQIELVRPQLLLALGRFAAQTLTGSTEPIGRLRQQRLQYQGIPLVVSYHPAYLLRAPHDKAKAWADLCLALDVLDAAEKR
jgi:DNA polymerase